MKPILTKGQSKYVQKILDGKRANILKAHTGSGKTLMTTVYAAMNIRNCDKTNKLPHIILFVSMNKPCVQGHSNILKSVSHKLNEKLESDEKPVSIINVSGSVFWRMWHVDTNDKLNMKIELINILNDISGKFNVTIIIDEMHTIVNNKNTTKCNKLHMLKMHFPFIRLLGTTATDTADNPTKQQRLKTVLASDEDEDSELVIASMDDETFKEIEEDLPFTNDASITKIPGITQKHLLKTDYEDIAFLLCLAATKIEGVAIPDAQKALREYVVSKNNEMFVEKLIDIIYKSPHVNISECNKVDTTTPESHYFLQATTGKMICSTIKLAVEHLTETTELDNGEEKDDDNNEVEDKEDKVMRTGKRGRIFFVISAIGKVALHHMRIALTAALDEQKINEGGIKHYCIVDATNKALNMDYIKEEAWKGNTVIVFAGADMMTGNNQLVGIVDTIVEHGNFSNSAHAQFMGRVAKRPVINGSKPDNIAAIIPNCRIMNEIDEHLRNTKEQNDPRETRKRKKDNDNEPESFENKAARLEVTFPFKSKIKEYLGEYGMVAIRKDPGNAKNKFEDIKKNLRNPNIYGEDDGEDEATADDITDQTDAIVEM